MEYIITALSDLWSQIESVIGVDVLNTILAVSLILFVYFLFFRSFLLLIKASKNIKLICDIVVVAICLLIVVGNLLPTFKIEKEVTNIDSSGSAGSSIVVNPVIEGTPETLSGLEVDGVQYVIADESPHLYSHNIYISTSSTFGSGDAFVYFTFYSSSSIAYTFSSFLSFFAPAPPPPSSYFPSSTIEYPSSGVVISSSSYPVFGIQFSSAADGLSVLYSSPSSGILTLWFYQYEEFTDTVIQIF